MFEDFGVALESGTTGALSQLAGDLGRDNTIERTLFETRMRAMMAGRLFVREFEQKRLTSRQLNRDNPNFLELPFSEVIDDNDRLFFATADEYFSRLGHSVGCAGEQDADIITHSYLDTANEALSE